MNRFFNVVLIQTILTISSFANAQDMAPQGGNISGGGDFHSQDLVRLGWRVYDQLFANYPEKMPKISLESFAQELIKTQVELSSEPLFLEGIPKHAINYPEKKLIKIDAKIWAQLTELPVLLPLVFHEYLGIMGLDDTKYAISAKLAVGMISARDELASNVARIAMLATLVHTYTGAVRSSWRKGSDLICYNIGQLYILIPRTTDAMNRSTRSGFENKEVAKALQKLAIKIGEANMTLRAFCGEEAGFASTKIERGSYADLAPIAFGLMNDAERALELLKAKPTVILDVDFQKIQNTLTELDEAIQRASHPVFPATPR